MLGVQAVALLGVGLVGHGLARRWGARPILGAVLAGLLLSPTVLGVLAPGFYRQVFTADTDEQEVYRVDREATDGARAKLLEEGAGVERIETFDEEAAARAGQLSEEAERSATPYRQRQALWLILPLCVGALTVLNFDRPPPVNVGAPFAASAQLALGAVLMPAVLGLLAGRLCIAFGWVDVSGPDQGVWLLGWVIGGMAVSWPVDERVLRWIGSGVKGGEGG
ncbi:MAG: hypothetical protein ACYTGQ_02565, partial [Planctomycetota bacterium]